MNKLQRPRRHRYPPIDPLKSPRFGDIVTFNRLPYVPDLQGKDVDVAIIGVPFDGGTTYRPGARFGPRSVRDASVLNRGFNPALGVSVYESLNVVDGGDVTCNPINIQSTLRGIEEHLGRIHSAGARAICVGGDHSILLAELRAARKRFGEFTLIHFDAHTDTANQAWGERLHHGTPVRRAIEEGALKGSNVFQIGIRGPLTFPSEGGRYQDEFIRKERIQLLDIADFHAPRRRKAFFDRLRKSAARKPCYITFDVDCVDPAFAPGTGTPVVGGLTSYEAIEALRSLRGLNIVGADVVEISPPYDHAEITSLLGAALVFELLSLMAIK